jgi:hypothetical protein
MTVGTQSVSTSKTIVSAESAGLHGTRIRAANLDDITPYRQPKPLEYRREPIPGAPKGYYTNNVYDPEDPDYKPAPLVEKGTDRRTPDGHPMNLSRLS